MDANMQLTINSFRQLFPDISLTFSKIPDISLTTVKFHEISRFSRQVVTLVFSWRLKLCFDSTFRTLCGSEFHAFVTSTFDLMHPHCARQVWLKSIG